MTIHKKCSAQLYVSKHIQKVKPQTDDALQEDTYMIDEGTCFFTPILVYFFAVTLLATDVGVADIPLCATPCANVTNFHRVQCFDW